jgi:carbamoyltransferase
VTPAANPLYYELIKAFGALTGVNALLNTSLNTNEEPIVCTPQQALKAFYGSGLDVLALGDFLLQK